MTQKFSWTNFIPLLALPAVILMPEVGAIFTPFTAWLLSALLFFSFMSTSMGNILQALKQPIKPFFVGLVVLILTPLVIFPIMQQFFPAYFMGALIFMLMPSAISSPAIAGIYGGNVGLATVNMITANLLSPFTITLFFALFFASAVQISLLTMLSQLAMIVIIPFVLAVGADRFGNGVVQKTRPYFRFISLLLIFLIFFGALAPYVSEMLSNLLNLHLWLAVLVTHIILYVFAKLTILYSRVKKERVAIESNLMFLNLGLAIVIAQNYFGAEEMLFIIFCEIVWVVLIAFFRYVK